MVAPPHRGARIGCTGSKKMRERGVFLAAQHVTRAAAIEKGYVFSKDPQLHTATCVYKIQRFHKSNFFTKVL